MDLRIRPFEDRDYARVVEIGAAIDPGYPFTADMLRYREAMVEPKIRRVRVVAELEDKLVAWGRVMHTWWAYHPGRYQLRLEVDPDWQHRGIGSTLFEELLGELRTWAPELVRVDTPATRSEALSFLEHRGFREWRRRWESVLLVADADLSPLMRGAQRAQAQGITLSTFAEVIVSRPDRAARDLYALEALIYGTEPGAEADAEAMSFERFARAELDSPDALPEAHFLALAGEHLVGVSRLARDLRHPDVLRQAFTGTHPEYRGRGIAQALKLRTVQFARDNGYREIRTVNDSTNEPMLHINDAIGFQRETPQVILERRLPETAPAGPGPP